VDFYSVIILSQEASGEVEANERSHEAQKSLGGAAHCPGRGVWCCETNFSMAILQVDEVYE
jgi:hypothetical protein